MNASASLRHLVLLVFSLACVATSRLAAQPATSAAASPNTVPDLRTLLSPPQNEMRVVAQRYQADRGNLSRYYSVTLSPEYYSRFKLFYSDWLAAVRKLDAAKLSEDGRAEQTRLVETIQRDLSQLDERAKTQAEIAPLVPFADVIIQLDQSRRRVDKVDPEKAAATVEDLSRRVRLAQKSIAGGASTDANGGAIHLTASLAGRAAETVGTLRNVLKNWHEFYDDYDPMFTWWLAQPYPEADRALQDYAAELRQAADKADVGIGESPVPPPPARLPEPVAIKLAGKAPQVPDLKELIAMPQSQLRGVIERFQGNRGGRGGRGGGFGGGPGGRGGGRPPTKEYYQAWLDGLQKLDFDKFNRDDQVNYLLLRNRVEYQLRRLDSRTEMPDDTSAFLPFSSVIDQLGDAANGTQEKFRGDKAADLLQNLKQSVDDARKNATAELEKGDAAAVNRAGSAARSIGGMRSRLQDWYDRNHTEAQWPDSVSVALKSVDQSLDSYSTFLREKSGGGARRDGSDIVGRPIGHDALMTELAGEMIPYTPEELIAIGEKEFAWCEAEMKKASREMGYGDDWKKALEKVKTMHVPAGDQPYLIRDLAWDAVNYLEKHDLITIPEIARETWRMEMMSLQRQMVNPFFTGGETISVSYPLSEMSNDQKEQSMRGNNIPFSRATVFHELIPGHEMQGFSNARYHPERRGFGTAFWGEGWAVYWELTMYQRGYPGTPENRIGALFWRMHRCARIVFSLKFHLNQWTPTQCIDYLVDRVGHERDNATAEVRRSFATSYGPLYQAAYLLGALQLRELHDELVKSHQMTDRAFHDAVLREGSMPVAMVRASLNHQKLTRDYQPDWRFYHLAAEKK
jgi:uncharacterized protein (DUF885 family)